MLQCSFIGFILRLMVPSSGPEYLNFGIGIGNFSFGECFFAGKSLELFPICFLAPSFFRR